MLAGARQGTRAARALFSVFVSGYSRLDQLSAYHRLTGFGRAANEQTLRRLVHSPVFTCFFGQARAPQPHVGSRGGRTMAYFVIDICQLWEACCRATVSAWSSVTSVVHLQYCMAEVIRDKVARSPSHYVHLETNTNTGRVDYVNLGA